MALLDTPSPQLLEVRHTARLGVRINSPNPRLQHSQHPVRHRTNAQLTFNATIHAALASYALLTNDDLYTWYLASRAYPDVPYSPDSPFYNYHTRFTSAFVNLSRYDLEPPPTWPEVWDRDTCADLSASRLGDTILLTWTPPTDPDALLELHYAQLSASHTQPFSTRWRYWTATDPTTGSATITQPTPSPCAIRGHFLYLTDGIYETGTELTLRT